MNHPRFLIQRAWGWSLRFYISNKLPGDADDTDLVPQVLCLTLTFLLRVVFKGAVCAEKFG